MLIVEGPDGSGKTTLCRTLSAEQNLDLAPIYAPSRRQMHKIGVRRRVWNGLSAMLRGQMYIHDRLYFSEVIYGTWLRGSVDFTYEEISWIEYCLDEMCVPIIVCLPSWEKVQEHLFDKPHLRGALDKQGEIYAAYRKLAIESTNLLVRPYDYTSEHDDIQGVIDWVIPLLTDLRRRFGDPDGGRTGSDSAGTEWWGGTEDRS